MTHADSAAQASNPDRRVYRNVARLAAAQALAGANASVIFATGAIVGSTLAPDKSLATLPISMFVVGMAAGTLPVGHISRQYGRRAAFLTGTGFGVVTGLLAMLALLIGSFPLFCVATFCGGLYGSVVQSFRFAAADGASPAFRPKALSWVMAGGVFAGILGPQLVTWTMDLWQPYLFAASYLVQAGIAVITAIVLAGVDLPKPPPSELAAGRKLGQIVGQARFITAALSGVVAYMLMNLVMTSAPLAMRMCGLPLSASNWAIQWHIVAMFGPSFFTGHIIARFGPQRVVAAGLVLTVAAALTNLAGLTVAHFTFGMILLGLGWNLSFVGASAMVLETHRPEERNKVQAFNDFVVFGIMACGSFLSGHVLASFGWDAINWIVFPPVALAFIALLFAGLLRRQPAAG
jgi:MFS family permease